MKQRYSPLALFLALCLLAAPVITSAQGRGQGQGQGQGRPKGPNAPNTPAPTAPSGSGSSSSGASSSGTSSPAPQPASTDATSAAVFSAGSDASAPVFDIGTTITNFRQFGAWLDDASTPLQGDGFMSVSAGQWRLASVTQTNIPMVAVGVGLTDRIQVSASLPFYRVSYQGGTAAGIDDVYLSGKINLLDPTLTLSEIGLAVSPVVEILSGGADRMHFAIPVSFEVRRFPFRVFASGGYFTRGSMFSGGALEWSSRGGTTLTGSLTQSYSLKQDVVLDELGVGRQRVDVTGSVSRLLGSSTIASVSVGRSLSSIDDGGTRLAVSGGLTFRFSAGSLAP